MTAGDVKVDRVPLKEGEAKKAKGWEHRIIPKYTKLMLILMTLRHQEKS